MIFRRNRAEYSDGIIDLIPIHFTPPDPAMGFGREQIWRITLHDHKGEIACLLLEHEIRISGKSSVVITCDPDNEPSRRTCIGLGCLFEGITDVPEDIRRKYEISPVKCRYIWVLSEERNAK